MDSALRPRDIQARIRAGETPESVAQVAGTPVERVMPFAAPVLAERAHVAQRAQRSSIRRRPSEGATPTTARTLGEAVTNRLRTLGVDDDAVEWDAWRRDDGRWELTAAFATTERAGAGSFVFDTPGNYVQLEDDDARWLVGDAPTAPAPAAPRDDLEAARARRGGVSLVDSELPLGEDALQVVAAERPDPAPEAETGTATGTATGTDSGTDSGTDTDAEPGHEREPGTAGDQDEAVLASFADDATVDLSETARRVRGDGAPVPAPEPTDVLFDSPVPAEADEAPAPPRPRRARKSRRASVPSWDEIMFGNAQGD